MKQMEMANRHRGRRGQSTVEYLLVVVMILLAVIYGIKTVLQPKVETQMDNAGTAVDTAGKKLQEALK